MPIETSIYGVNNINYNSPDLRDTLLKKNLILSSTVKLNGYESYAIGLGYPAELYTLPPTVKDLEQVNNYDSLILYNKYKNIQKTTTSINYLPSSFVNGEFYYNGSIIGGSKLTSTYKTFLDNLTKNNEYNGDGLNTLVDITYKPNNFDKSFTNYQEKLNQSNLGKVLQPLDVINSFIQGGIGDNITKLDLRTSLLGRVLTTSNLFKDTKIGVIGAKQLYANMLNNFTSNVVDETVGNLNLNPLSLLMGNDVIVKDFKITSNKGVSDIFSRLTGINIPKRNLDSLDWLSYEKTPIGNIERSRLLLEETGSGQKAALLSNLNRNSDKDLGNGFKRRGYRAGYDGVISPKLYVGDNGDGSFVDLQKNNGYPLPTNFFNLGGSKPTSKKDVKTSQFSDEFDDLMNKNMTYPIPDLVGYEDLKSVSKFSWEGENTNITYVPSELSSGFDKDKGILSHTNKLFKSDLMRTMVNSKGFNSLNTINEELETLVKVGGNYWQSKGSGILTTEAINGTNTESNGEDVFCRSWTKADRYDQVRDLIRNSGLITKNNKLRFTNPSDSVLDDNGYVKIAPYAKSPISDAPKKYMFSIENLAWSNEGLQKLLPCEIGNGDLLSNKKGRIMWFAPYGLTFSENSSVSLNEVDFIGRGEPVYTYNNTRRSGSLSFMLVVDHPDILNNDNVKSQITEEKLASFFGGCYDIFDDAITPEQKDAIAKASVVEKTIVSDETQTAPNGFDYYFPHDSAEIDPNYENGDGLGLNRTKSGKFHAGKTDFYQDRTDFGLNGPNSNVREIQYDSKTGVETSFILRTLEENEKRFKLQIENGGNTYNGIFDSNYFSDLKKYIIEKCPACRVEISGYANSAGKSTNNQSLSEARANAIAKLLKENVFNDDIINSDDRFTSGTESLRVNGLGQVGSCASKTIKGIEGSKQPYDTLECKLDRKVTVKFVYDPKLSQKITDKKTEIKNEKEILELLNNSLNYYCESDYFQKLAQDSPIAFSKITEKLKFFHPAFHSTTPEGFNSRLTFLNQCTRQGSTEVIGRSQDGKEFTKNLAFGTPPVCILRIGDFYNTKILINDLSIDYEQVWDLNPEGIGVQPMIANVTLNFVFIGGSDLQSPINKLQNAISFNYYANTQTYEPRADKIVKDSNGYKLNGGIFPKVTNMEQNKTMTSTNTNIVKTNVDFNDVNKNINTSDVTPKNTVVEGNTGITTNSFSLSNLKVVDNTLKGVLKFKNINDNLNDNDLIFIFDFQKLVPIKTKISTKEVIFPKQNDIITINLDISDVMNSQVPLNLIQLECYLFGTTNNSDKIKSFIK